VAAQQDEAKAQSPNDGHRDAPGEVEPRKHVQQSGQRLKAWRHLLHMNNKWVGGQPIYLPTYLCVQGACWQPQECAL
jgi:hypothetical protein